MRPTPAEVILGVRRILKDVIEPEVGSEYARARLAEVRAVLAQVDWDDSLTTLARDNATVADLARRAGSWIRADARRQDVFGTSAGALARVSSGDRGAP